MAHPVNSLPICSISAPKTGSHMLGFGLGLTSVNVHLVKSGRGKGEYRSAEDQIKQLDEMNRPGVWAHIAYTDRMHQYLQERFTAMFFIRRDPRDVVVSTAYYYKKYPPASNDLALPDGTSISEMPWDERLLWLITHLGLTLPHYSGWIRDGVYQVKYEDVVDHREREFTKIQEHLEGLGLKPPSGEEMAEMSQDPHKLSFRRGKHGDWREEFKDHHVQWTEKYLRPVMTDWGY